MPSASVYEISKIRAQVIVFFHRFQNSQKHQCNSYFYFVVHIFGEKFPTLEIPFILRKLVLKTGEDGDNTVDNFCKKQFLTVHYLLTYGVCPFSKGRPRVSKSNPLLSILPAARKLKSCEAAMYLGHLCFESEMKKKLCTRAPVIQLLVTMLVFLFQKYGWSVPQRIKEHSLISR